MKRHALPLLALLLLPAATFAQPARDPADTVTGVERPAPGVQVNGINPSKLKDYLAAVQAVDATLQFETSGQTRTDLKVDSFTLRSSWRQPAPGQPAVLTSMEITPQRGQRLGGKVNKVTVDGRGRMHVDISGMPDVTISKMTRDRHGNLVLHTDEWLIPNIHVRASDGMAYVNIGPFKKEVGNLAMLLKLEHWPPRLDDLAKLMEGGQGAGPPLTGTVRYDLRGTADATGLPLPAELGRVSGSANIATSGTVRLEPDGTMRTIGDSGLTLEMRVGTRGANLEGVRAGEGSGHVSYDGRYNLSIPGGDMSRTRVVADGQVSFALNGRNLVMNLPSGAKVMAGGAELRGGGRLRADILGGAGSFTLRDGTYRLRLSGPVGVEGLAMPGLVAENLRGSGELTSNGNFSLDGDRVAARGDLTGRVVAEEGSDSTGFLRAMGEDGEVLARARVRAGSSVDVNLSSVEVGGRPADQPNSMPNLGDARATGTVTADLRLDEVSVNDPRLSTSGGRADLRLTAELDANVEREGERMTPEGSIRARADLNADLNGVRATLPDGSLSASRLHLEGGGDLLAGPDGVTLTDGTATVRLDGEGRLDMGLPGGPVGARRPAVQPGSETRAVVGNLSAGSQLNLRGGPSTSAQVLGKLAAGTSLRVLGRQGEWSQVQLSDGRRGYVHNDYLTGLTTVNRPAPREEPSAPVSVPPGRVSTTLAAGSSAELELDRVRVARGGEISASGRIVAARVVLGATDLRAGSLEAKVLGSATVALQNVRFEASNAGLRLPQRVSVPVRVELAPGSRVKLNLPGRETEVTLDRGGSYAEFTAQVQSDDQGALSLQELTSVDLKLVTTAAARLMGDMATVNGEKSLEFKGRVAFVGGGFDLYGSLAVRVAGDDRTPILSVRP
mgnify:CR=1 FL=1